MQSGLLLFLDISGGEFLVIVLAIFLIFGPKKMPAMARKIGRVINEIKHASGELTREFREETGNIAQEIKQTRESIHRESEKLKSDLLETKATAQQALDIQYSNNQPVSNPDAPSTKDNSVESNPRQDPL